MRSPWSIPTKFEFAQLGVGVALGAALCMLFVSVGEPKFGWTLVLIMPGVLYVSWMTTSFIGWARESAAREKDSKLKLAKLERESAESRYWSYKANRAASNKKTGQQWTGHRPGRRSRTS